MQQILKTYADFKKPNILILDTPIELDFSRANVTIEPLENIKKKSGILGLFEGKMEISDDFDAPLL